MRTWMMAAITTAADRSTTTLRSVLTIAAWRIPALGRDLRTWATRHARTPSPRRLIPAAAAALAAAGVVSSIALLPAGPGAPASVAGSSRVAVASVAAAAQVDAAELVYPPAAPQPGAVRAAIAHGVRHAARVRASQRARARELAAARAAAAASAAASTPAASTPASPQPTPAPSGGAYGYPGPGPDGIYTFADMEALWVWAGGPAAVEADAATIGTCESGGKPWAYNASGASGLMQILGAPSGWTGSTDWFDPGVNMRAAVAKYNQAGGFSPWVCPP